MIIQLIWSTLEIYTSDECELSYLNSPKWSTLESLSNMNFEKNDVLTIFISDRWNDKCRSTMHHAIFASICVHNSHHSHHLGHQATSWSKHFVSHPSIATDLLNLHPSGRSRNHCWRAMKGWLQVLDLGQSGSPTWRDHPHPRGTGSVLVLQTNSNFCQALHTFLKRRLQKCGWSQ